MCNLAQKAYLDCEGQLGVDGVRGLCSLLWCHCDGSFEGLVDVWWSSESIVDVAVFFSPNSNSGAVCEPQILRRGRNHGSARPPYETHVIRQARRSSSALCRGRRTTIDCMHVAAVEVNVANTHRPRDSTASH
jgi:hypothetical protein